MKQACIVTGLCRAGGSAVAEVAHCLGYPMGLSFMAPIAPDYRFDFEDAELTARMAENVNDGCVPLTDFDIRVYLARRIEHSHAAGCEGRLGFKSPLLSVGPTMEQLEFALLARGYTSVVVRVDRSAEAIERSVARQHGAVVLRRWNRAIEQAGPVPFDVRIQYEALVADPPGQVGALAARLGVVDHGVIAQAAARVGRPIS